jgi:hypothetical protein
MGKDRIKQIPRSEITVPVVVIGGSSGNERSREKGVHDNMVGGGVF